MLFGNFTNFFLNIYYRAHSEEMEDLVDVVADLETKKEELDEMKLFSDSQTLELTKIKKELHKVERDSKYALEKSESDSKREINAAATKIEDLQGQIKFLNESMGNMRVDHDLQLEKLRKEKDQDGSSHTVVIQQKENTIGALNEEIDRFVLFYVLVHHFICIHKKYIFPSNCRLKVELEMSQDELAAKTEEVDELQADLEIKESGFNNSFRETEESHKDEIEILVSKIEQAKQEISDLNENLARTKAEHISTLDEFHANKKSEVHNLQDQVSEKDRIVLDLQAQISTLGAKLSSATSSAEDETKMVYYY